MTGREGGKERRMRRQASKRRLSQRRDRLEAKVGAQEGNKEVPERRREKPIMPQQGRGRGN